MADYYTSAAVPSTGAALASAVVRSEFANIAAGFVKIAPYTGHAGEFLAVNAGATGQTSLSAADARTALSLTIGTNVQAWDVDLDAIAGLTSAANKGIMFTGSHTAGTYDLTAAGLALLDDADAAAQRVTLGVAIGDHEVVVTTGNGFGSGSTKIRRFTTTESSVGTAITYADSGTLGGTFTITIAGIYAISYLDSKTTTTSFFGVSVNSNQLTTDINSITASTRKGISWSPAANASPMLTTIVSLAVNDVVRAHSDGTQDATSAALTRFSIRMIGRTT